MQDTHTPLHRRVGGILHASHAMHATHAMHGAHMAERSVNLELGKSRLERLELA